MRIWGWLSRDKIRPRAFASGLYLLLCSTISDSNVLKPFMKVSRWVTGERSRAIGMEKCFCVFLTRGFVLVSKLLYLYLLWTDWLFPMYIYVCTYIYTSTMYNMIEVCMWTNSLLSYIDFYYDFFLSSRAFLQDSGPTLCLYPFFFPPRVLISGYTTWKERSIALE